MDSDGVPAPVDWDSTNLPFLGQVQLGRQQAELMFTGPLRDKEEADKYNYLLLWIGEKGRDVYNTWTLTGDEVKKLKTYYDKYTAYITPKAGNPIYARYKFHERLQGEHESIEKFVTELKLLVKDCGYQNGDEMMRDRIVFATNSQHVREKLLSQGADLTLEKAMDIARSYELAKHQLKTMGGSGDHDTVHTVRENTDAYEEDIDEENTDAFEEDIDEEESGLYIDSMGKSSEQAYADIELGSPPKMAKIIPRSSLSFSSANEEQSCRPTVAVMQTTMMEPVIKLHRIDVLPAKFSVKSSLKKQPRDTRSTGSLPARRPVQRAVGERHVAGASQKKKKKTYHCDQCGKQFDKNVRLQDHQRIHTGEKPYSCDQCGKQFRGNAHLQVHQKIHTGEKPHTGEKLHTGEKPYFCDQCGKTFTQSGSFRLHQRIHTGERPYSCDQCGKKFRRKAHLQEHQRIHTGEKPYFCDQCGKTFIHSASFKLHQRTHTGEKPHSCDQCEKAFSHLGDLKKHLRRHTGEKPYRCDQCGKGFVDSSDLKKHVRSHTGEKPHLCDKCGKGFGRKQHLKSHQRSHSRSHRQKPYLCNQCGKSFSQSNNLKQHQRTHTTVTSGADESRSSDM